MRMSVSIGLLVALAAPLQGLGDFFGHSQTLREQFDEADVVATARAGEVKDHGASAVIWGYRQFEILQTIKGAKHQVGKEVVIDCPPTIKPGDLFLIVGERLGTDSANKPRFLFSTFLNVDDQMIDYIVDAPPSSSSEVVKLAYYLPKLVSDNEDIRSNAHHICRDMKLQNLVSARDSIPVEFIRSSLRTSESVDDIVEDFNGLLLGLAGDPSDSHLLLDVINRTIDEDGSIVISQSLTGLVLLTGEHGVEWIDKNCLALPIPPPPAPANPNFKISWCGMKAIRDVWRLKQQTTSLPNLSEERLSQSIQLLLEQPQIADLAINDLAWCSDWSHMDEFYVRYDSESYDVPIIKRAIVHYYLAAIHAKELQPTDEQRAAAEKYFAKLSEDDPKTVEMVERWLRIFQ